MGQVLNLSDDEFNDFANYVNRVGVSDGGVMLQESRSLLAKARKDTRPENMTEEMRHNGFSWALAQPENVDNLPKSVKNLSGKPREAWEGLVDFTSLVTILLVSLTLLENWSKSLQTPMQKFWASKIQSRRLRLNYTRTVPARSDTSDRVSYGRRKPALLFGF